MSGAAEAAAVASPTKSGGGGEDAELPKALLKRILKARLAEWDAQQNGGDGSRDFQINKVRARFGWSSSRAALGGGGGWATHRSAGTVCSKRCAS